MIDPPAQVPDALTPGEFLLQILSPQSVEVDLDLLVERLALCDALAYDLAHLAALCNELLGSVKVKSLLQGPELEGHQRAIAALTLIADFIEELQ